MNSLDLGCGKNKKPGCIGLDMNSSLEDVDVAYEIRSRVLLPFKDNSFSLIYMIDIAEHIQDVPWLLSEVHRIAVPDAKVKLQYPHYSGRNAYGDVTHTHAWGFHAFDHFDPNTNLGQKYQYYTLFGRNFPFELVRKKPKFKIKEISALLYNIVGMDCFEEHFSKFLPVSDVKLELRILK